MINETISQEHKLKPGDVLYDRINNSSVMKSLIERMETRVAERAAWQVANPESATVYEPRDLSYYLDGTTKFAGGYSFVYKDNTVTAEIDFNPNETDPIDIAFIKTHNLNVKGQALAAGLSEKKATELAMGFSEEYIKIRSQTNPDEIDAGKIASAALQKLASQGWPHFLCIRPRRERRSAAAIRGML